MTSFHTKDPAEDIEAILRQHQMEQWHLCTACGSQYSERSDLMEHMKSHSLPEPRKCTITKAVVTSPSLEDNSVYMSKKFIIIAHDWKVRTLPAVKDLKDEGGPNPEDRKSFACDDCGKHYDGRLQLAIHDFCKRSYGNGCSENDPQLSGNIQPFSFVGDEVEIQTSTPSQLPWRSFGTSLGGPNETEFSTGRLASLTTGTGSRRIGNPGSSEFDANSMRGASNSVSGVKIKREFAPDVMKAATSTRKFAVSTSGKPRHSQKEADQPDSSFLHRRGVCTCVMCRPCGSVPGEFDRVHTPPKKSRSVRGGRGGRLGAARQSGAGAGKSANRARGKSRFLPY